MIENEKIVIALEQHLTAGSPVVVASIIRLEGSVPRHTGTKMAVTNDGKSYGTIGGGPLEAAVIREAQGALSAGASKVVSYNLAGKDAPTLNMMCGGSTDILLDYIAPSPGNLAFAGYWRDAIQRGNDFYVLTHLKGEGGSLEVSGHAILYPDGNTAGATSLTPTDVKAIKPELHNITTTEILPLGNTEVLVDRIRKMKTLFCFGAGHVAVPTVHLAALVGFRVIVVDDRAEYANAERYPEAAEVRVIDDFDHAFDPAEVDADSFIVIVTRGHQYDKTVLKQAIKTKAGYIGMISSRRKKQALFDALIAEGINKEFLEQVYSPIGISIGGETPEEIAVSIVAELVKVRSEQSS